MYFLIINNNYYIITLKFETVIRCQKSKYSHTGRNIINARRPSICNSRK